ncbi:MAG: hypothetical protein RMK18_09485 [Armatimonadota bacterium]|nr:hypothetical protein [Armatimonadota bacterium]MDW8026075.1 hypothetical protein [Armatimonadota bacterium]
MHKFTKAMASGDAYFLILRKLRWTCGYGADEKFIMAFVRSGGQGDALAGEFASLEESMFTLCNVD